MPWSQSSLMNERMIFIAACLSIQEPGISWRSPPTSRMPMQHAPSHSLLRT
jgi:hypothetical protein